MSSKCSGSFYDALGGKHVSGQLFAVVAEKDRPAINYTIVRGVSAGENEIHVEDLARLCSDERFKVSVHSHGWKGAPIPFDPENYKGRRARKLFDAEKARISLGNSYAPWLEECARNLPTAPDDSLDYSRKVATAFLANLSGTGLVDALTKAPGVLATGPQVLLERFWGNSGMVDVAARVFVDRLTPPITAQEAALLYEYLGHTTFDERNDLCLKVLERLGLWDSSSPISAPPLTGDEEVDEDPPSPLMNDLRARTWMLAIELGVPELAEMLGCSTDPEDSLYRLNIYDLAAAAGKRRPGYVAAQESVARRAAAVALSVARRHKMVTYSVDVGLLTQDGTQPHPGQPLLWDGEVQGSMQLVGVTASGEVLTFQDADSLEPARRFSDDDKGLVSRYPSIEDAVRGTKGIIFNYKERDAVERSALDRESGGMFEQPLRDNYMEFVASGGEYEGERDDRARLLARLEFRGTPEPGIDGNAATGQQGATLIAAFDSEFGHTDGPLWHKASSLCEEFGHDSDKMERLLRFMVAHREHYPWHTFRAVASTSCPEAAIESVIGVLDPHDDVFNQDDVARGLREGLRERAKIDEKARDFVAREAAEQKNELKKGHEKRATSAPPVADLRSMDLRGYDLSYLDLSGLDLSGLDMSAANLAGTDLTGTDLTGTDLTGANLRGTKLGKTILNGTIMNKADFTGADLRGMDFSKVHLRGANFSGANLSGANLSRHSSDDSGDDSGDDVVEEFRNFLDGVDPDDFRD